MATKTEVKQYLAHWMQLGCKLVLADRLISMDRVIAGDHYTTLFEEVWQQGEAHPDTTWLEGCAVPLKELFAANYEVLNCPRCNMLLPSQSSGPRSAQPCPCDHLKLCPNFDTVPPRDPVQTNKYLAAISDRLQIQYS